MPRRSPLLVVYITVFLDLLGFGIILPALPFYAHSFGATGLWIGVLLSAYSVAQFIGAPLLGRISDRLGRRPVILLSLAGSAVSLLLTGLATTLLMLLVGRALAGLFGGSIAAAQAYIADVTLPEQRARYMGMLGASIGLGFVFGPAIGAGLSRFGFGTAALVAASLAAVNLLFGLVALPESRQPGVVGTRRARPTLPRLAASLRAPIIGPLLAATFLTTLAFVGMETTYALLGARLYQLTPEELGLIFAFLGVIIVVVQGGLIGRLTARYGERSLAVVGALLLAAALLLLPFLPSLPLALPALGLLAIGQGLTTPTLASLLSRTTSADEQGSILGISQALAAGARAIGPLLAGWLFDRGVPLPYLLGAGAVVLAAWLVGRQSVARPFVAVIVERG